MPTLSAVVVARDEAEMIAACLRRLHFADEVIVAVDDRSVDATADLARGAGAAVHTVHFENFAQIKNAAIDLARGDWVLIVDADERVTAPLAAEIREALCGPHVAYHIPIENWFYGSRIRHNRWREAPIRLIRSGSARYTGLVHETLEFPAGGSIGSLRHGLAHFSHRSILENLAKTQRYADLQARDMLAAGHPRVTWRTLLRVVGGELSQRLLIRRGFQDGTPGVIEGLYQPFATMCIYARLWELQQKPSIAERYAEADRSLP